MGSWDAGGSDRLKLLLAGPRRTGKSSSGNTLLGGAAAFDSRGGGISAAASSVAAGRHVSVVDAQGWGASEESVPREEKIELIRALELCGPRGPHCVLLVIPLLDFTEPERRAVERRMELLTSAVWRHTMVLFTFGERLRARGISVEEHIRSGGPALHWLMETCRYRYHVFENKAPANGQLESRNQEDEGVKEREGTWRKDEKKAGRRQRGGEADGGQEQVKQLLSKVEDMLHENGGWHFSLHMYQRLEEEWSRREQRLRARLEAQLAESRERKQKPEEIGTETEREEKKGGRTREEGGQRVERKINRDEEETMKVDLKRWSSQEEGCDTSSDSGGETEGRRGASTKGGKESTEKKSGLVQCQRLAFSMIRRLQ